VTTASIASFVRSWFPPSSASIRMASVARTSVDEQDWKEIVAWLQGLADLAARQRRSKGGIIEADQK
jgi:hypothetical protein